MRRCYSVSLSLCAIALALPTGCSMMGGSTTPVSGVCEENEVTRTATVQKIDLANAAWSR